MRSFDGFLKDLLQNCIMNYMTNDNPIIRKEAALTAAKLIGVTTSKGGNLSIYIYFYM